jgi:hypothetical protein
MKRLLTSMALLAAIAVTPACGDLQSRAHFSVARVAYTPEGTLAVFTNGGIFLFDDARLQAARKRIALDGLPAFDEGSLYSFSLSSNGSVAAVGYRESHAAATPVALYRLATGQHLGTIDAASGLQLPVVDIALSPNGDLLAVARTLYDAATMTASGPMVVIDTLTKEDLWQVDGNYVMPTWSRDGLTLYAANFSLTSSDEFIEAHDIGGAMKWRQEAPRTVLTMAPTAGDTLLASLAIDPDCLDACELSYPYWSPADGTLTAELPPSPNVGNVFAPERRVMFACAAADTACAVPVMDFTTEAISLQIYRPDGTVVGQVPLPSSLSSIALSPDAQFVAIVVGRNGGYSDDVVNVYRVADGTLVGSHSFVADLL